MSKLSAYLLLAFAIAFFIHSLITASVLRDIRDGIQERRYQAEQTR